MKKEKRKRPKKNHQPERTPKESSALLIGILAVVLSGIGILMLIFNVPVLVSAIFAGAGVLCGFGSLLFGKGGALPAVVAIVAGFMCVLAVVVLSASV